MQQKLDTMDEMQKHIDDLVIMKEWFEVPDIIGDNETKSFKYLNVKDWIVDVEQFKEGDVIGIIDYKVKALKE